MGQPPIEDPQWLDPEEWAEQATGDLTDDDLIRRSTPGHTELWLRGVFSAPEVFTEVGATRFVFTPSDLKSGRAGAIHDRLVKIVPPGLEFTWLAISESRAHWQTSTRHQENKEPLRVPLWRYGDDPATLVRYARRFTEQGWPLIVVGFFPHDQARQEEAAAAYEFVHRVAANYPDARLHLAFARRYAYAFGLNFASADINPVKEARYGGTILPNGKECRPGGARFYLKWLHVIGFSARDIETFEGRVRFNIASAAWAAEHWNDKAPFGSTAGRSREDPLGLWAPAAKPAKGTPRPARLTYRRLPHRPTLGPDVYPQSSPDPNEPYAFALPVKAAPMVPIRPRGGDSAQDKVTCDTCSLAPTCRLYREGSVCTLPDSPTTRLATMFGTRDVETVKGALVAVLAAQTDRYERSAQTFREDDESDVKDLKRSDHLLKMENSLLRNIETLVKILDPAYRPNAIAAALTTGPVTNVFNPQVLVANVVKELEARGVDRKDIDVAQVYETIQHTPAAIES